MRVTSVGILSDDGVELIQFDFRNVAAKSQYVIRNSVGLDADAITPRFYGFSKDGTKRFYELKPKPKDIVMRIVLNPRYRLNETVSDIRDNIYKSISATRSGELTLEFRAGASISAYISGHVTKLEVGYFGKVPEVQLTIRCEDAMFRGLNPVVLSDAELPTVNPIKVADSISTAPHGFAMQLTFTATVATFTIQDKAVDPEWDFKIIPSSSFLAGDILYFSSEFTNRYLYRVRAGVTTHLLDAIEPTSVWPIIFPRSNEFHFVNIASIDLDEISFIPAFWGV